MGHNSTAARPLLRGGRIRPVGAGNIETALANLNSFSARVSALRGSFFGEGPIVIARAPGRLDVMGGVSDYSGGLVLEGTLAEGTLAAVQADDSHVLIVRSESAHAAGLAAEVRASLSILLEGEALASPETVRERLAARADSERWAAYPLGCLYAAMAHTSLGEYRGGIRIYLESDVPLGAGVSSSAALEVAVFTAINALFGLGCDGLEMARLCQLAENQIAGAPCGIMDQVTSALGREGALLALECRPHTILGYAPIPEGWRFVGLDSGVKHSVGGRHYTRARIGAFMGLRIAESLLGRSLNGYLTRLSPAEWSGIRTRVPEVLSGSDFLAAWGEYPDTATAVDPSETYRVRDSAEHPILENARVRRFRGLMEEGHSGRDSLLEAGGLMLESHRSYSERLELGSPETDLLVELAMSLGPERGIYGAKITGGGSGGTVALLCSGAESKEAVEAVRAEYRRRTGILPLEMTGSSPGAIEMGTRAV